MTSFITRLHEELRRSRLFRREDLLIQSDAPNVGLKKYDRMPRIALSEPRPLLMPLGEVLSRRESYEGGTEQSIQESDLSSLLHASLRIRPESDKRPYPSGGGLYPIETYVIGDVDPGTGWSAYHYDPSAHALEHLLKLRNSAESGRIYRIDDLQFSMAILFTGIWSRSSEKYGDFTYLLGVLEAGHMAQNILLSATALGLHARPVAGFDDVAVTEILDLDTNFEQPLYCVVLSR